MRHERLRETPTTAELDAMYPSPHDHVLWGHGHHVRVQKTIQLAHDCLTVPLWPQRIADLSCGNGAIAKAIARPEDTVILGDYAPGCAICGPIEDTLELIEPVEVFVCAETLEHLDDPATVLTRLRDLTAQVVISTPVDNWGDTNGEHLWSWDRDYVEDMLHRAGFLHLIYDNVDSREWKEPYNYGIWVGH